MQQQTPPPDFTQLLKRLSRRYSEPVSGHGREMADLALGEIAQFVGFDTAVLVHLSSAGVQRTLACWIGGREGGPNGASLVFECPWVVSRVSVTKEPEAIDPATEPDIPEADRTACACYGTRSLYGIPLFGELDMLAILILGCSQPEKKILPETLSHVQVLAECVVNATLQAEREERLSDAIEAAETGLWSLDYSTMTFWATEAARVMHGFDATEEISVDMVIDAVHPEDRELVKQIIEQAAVEPIEVRVEYRIPLDDGSVRWLVARGRSYVTIPGKPQQLMGVSVDVTERRLAEEELRNARALKDAMFNSVPGMLYLYRSDGRLVSWNKQHENLTGYSAAELLHKPITEIVVEEDHQAVWEGWSRAFAEGHAQAEVNVRMKDGSVVPYAVTGVPLMIDGQPHLVGMSIDITEKRRAQGAVAELRNELTHAARVNSLGELASGLAHELNQPLAAILSNAQAARRFLAVSPPNLDEVQAAIDDIIRDDKRAGEIVHGLRALVGKNKSLSELLDLNMLIGAVADLIHNELIAYDVSLLLELDAGLLKVFGGQTEIQQVLLNFLLNGIQAQHQISSDMRRLVVKTWHGPDTVIAAVRDNGTGIPEDDLPHIFEPFFSTKNQGLGMGLAICRRIAQSYGGRVWAENNADGGATFYLALPLAKEND